jgi:hypothetical protein
MLPGYLHFDVRQGLKADMLNGSMSALLSDHQCVRDAFDALDLKDITFVVGEHTARNMKGRMVHFYVGTHLINADHSKEITKPLLSKVSPRWDCYGVHKINSNDNNGEAPCFDSLLPRNDFLRACLYGESINLKHFQELFLLEKIKPSVAALALKILKNLESSIFEEFLLSGKDALWFFCHLLMLCVQVDALNPKFISASKLYFGENRTPCNKIDNTLSIFNETWLKSVVSTMPVIEIDESIEVDVLAIAFLKALAGQFGARGESTIMHIGVGYSAWSINGLGHIEALWCEARLPDSMNECGIHNNARLSFVYEISGMVPAMTEMPYFCSTLSLHGAVSISWHLVSGEKSATFYQVKFFCRDDEKRDAVEAFLIKGSAYDVSVRLVERHELNRRLVSVPMGTGNKTSSIRFVEYIYFDKTVRVEPLKEDLDHYVQKTDYSVDVARSDLLLAWKKWRERVAKENT